MSEAFIYGFILSFGLIIPLGVQNIFIFNQGAIQKSPWRALPSVLTAFVCDAALILLSILGLSLVVLNITWLKTTIFIVGFIFLMIMGYKTWVNASKPTIEARSLPAKQQILFAFSVSLLNPHAIIDSISVIGTNSLRFMGHEKIAFGAACVTVSFVWFLGLSLIGHFLQKMDRSGSIILGLNKISALIVWGVGLNLGYEILMDL